MIYYRGRWLIEPEIKALLTKLEAENEGLKQENTVVLRETDRLIKEKGQLIAENYEAKKLLRENAELRAKVESADRQIAEYKRLLKKAFEDIVWLNEHTVDGEGQCLIETATDMETCLACPLNVNNSHVCGWKHQVEALALIGEEGDTE